MNSANEVSIPVNVDLVINGFKTNTDSAHNRKVMLSLKKNPVNLKKMKNERTIKIRSNDLANQKGSIPSQNGITSINAQRGPVTP